MSIGRDDVMLMIPNPRRIPACMDAFNALDTDIAWLTGMAAREIPYWVNQIIDETDYAAYVVCADDCIVPQQALDAVIALLDAGHPAVTGWCRLDRTHDLANICDAPIVGDAPAESAYPFYRADDVLGYPDEVVPTHFMGMALTGMTRAMWKKYPHGCLPNGTASDWHLSIRLRDDGVPMVAARSGFVDHVKETWNRSDRAPENRILVGHVDPEVRVVAKVRP